MSPDSPDADSILPGAQFVASRGGRAYFTATGGAWREIAPADRVWFPSEEAARNAGYEPSAASHEGLSEFEILATLGRGASATVFRARDRVLRREVAIKVIRAPDDDADEARLRFTREGRVLANLHHPNVVSVYGVKELPAGGLALIMEYIPGRTLRELIHEEGPLSVERAEAILRDVGEALMAAHQHGIIHRDVKPANIFLHESTGRALLADFGIAIPVDDPKITRAGTVIGTPAYMSPEQIDGEGIGGQGIGDRPGGRLAEGPRSAAE